MFHIYCHITYFLSGFYWQMTEITTKGPLTSMWAYNMTFYKKKKNKKCIKNSKNVPGDELVKIKTPFQPLNVSFNVRPTRHHFPKCHNI